MSFREATVLYTLLFILIFCAPTAEGSTSAFLAIKPVPDDFFDEATEGSNPELAGRDKALFWTGIVNPAGLSIESIRNISLYDAADNQVPLLIDTTSIYSEFGPGEINSMHIAFVIDETALEAGMPRLAWGSDIEAENREVEKMTAYLTDKARYRTFTLEKKPGEGEGSSYIATLEVIVDDYADVYYIWYLLPMVLIFGLLLVKKILAK